MGLASVVLHNLCIDKGDFIPRKFDLTFDHMTNNCRDRSDLRHIQTQIDQIMQILEETMA